MANVIASLTMSVDGFIALPDDSVGHLFDWYESGEVAVPWPGMGMVSHVTPASAGYLNAVIERAGAIWGSGDPPALPRPPRRRRVMPSMTGRRGRSE